MLSDNNQYVFLGDANGNINILDGKFNFKSKPDIQTIYTNSGET